MKRTYVLDTNVLLYDHTALSRFEENDLVIPMTVIEEIDTFKKDMSEIGYAARYVSRFLDGLREQGSLREGVDLPGGGTLRVAFTDDPLAESSNDNQIIRVAQDLRKDDDNVILVSRDTNMRIKGDAIGVTSEDYQTAGVGVESDGLYTGFAEVHVDTATVDRLFRDCFLPNDFEGLVENQFVLVKNGKQSGLAQLQDDELHLLPKNDEGVWGIHPRNKEQLFALHLLMNPDINLVTISGIAGTGKTLLALAAGMALTADAHKYRKVLVSRPIFPMGKDLGYLPGTIEEKLNPWMKPIFDNLELMVGSTKKDANGRGGKNYQYLLDTGVVEVEPLTYIRGRSIPNQFMIIDEAQNLTPHEVKTILTRAGEGTKIVLTGDPAQIDNPYVDSLSNGLTYVIERFKGHAMAGHVTLTKGERSALAALAAELL